MWQPPHHCVLPQVLDVLDPMGRRCLGPLRAGQGDKHRLTLYFAPGVRFMGRPSVWFPVDQSACPSAS